MEHNHSSNRCREQLQALRALDFAIQDTVLYLDAYPDHPEALAFYHALLAEREKVLHVYQKGCGPQTIYANESHTSWDWVKGPWPWEIDAN